MLLAKKKNMTQIYDEASNVIPVTVLDYSECFAVTGQKKSGNYVCISKKQNPSKPEIGKFGEDSVPVFARRLSGEAGLDELNLGDVIQVSANSKGKGFAGVVRMWRFKGGKRTHGQSDRQRHPGSIGCRTIPGRVYKGKKMARRKGDEQVTIKNLQVVSVDAENKLICVKGSVPGKYDSIVTITK